MEAVVSRVTPDKDGPVVVPLDRLEQSSKGLLSIAERDVDVRGEVWQLSRLALTPHARVGSSDA